MLVYVILNLGTEKSEKMGNEYFVIVNKDKEEIKKSFKEKELQNVLKKGEKIEKRKYEGCPRHKTKASDNILDMFA